MLKIVTNNAVEKFIFIILNSLLLSRKQTF